MTAFWQRETWRDCGRTRWDWFACFEVNPYVITLVIGCVFYGVYTPMFFAADVTLKWFDIWPVIALLAVKIALQFDYFCGKPFVPKDEKVAEKPFLIREILVAKLGHSSIAAIVEAYLPLFHSSSYCPPHLLVRRPEQYVMLSVHSNEE